MANPSPNSYFSTTSQIYAGRVAPPPPPPPPPAPTLTISSDGAAVVGVAEAITVTAANLATAAAVTVARVSGPAASISPVPVNPAPGELTKLAYATAAAIGTLALKASATIDGNLVESNTINVSVTAAPSVPTTATLSGASTASTGVAHSETVTLDSAADQTYTITWSRSDGGTGGATSTITAGQTSVSASSTWGSASLTPRTVDFTISPSLTRAGRPLPVTVSDVAPPPSAGTPQPFTLTSSVSGVLPFAIGYALAQGHVPSGSSLSFSGATAKLVVQSTWPDGSARVGIVAGTYTSAGSAVTVTPTVATVSAGTPLTGADIQAAMGGNTVVIGCGAIGTATWSAADFAAPFLTHAATDGFINAVYRKPVGSDAHLVAWLEVRYWPGQPIEFLPWIENGYLNVAGPTNKSETYSFTLGGTSRFSAAIDLANHQRTPLVSGALLSHWLGTDPQVTAKHDAAYLMVTKLVPTYSATVSPSDSIVTGLPSTFTPLQAGSLPGGMGAPGYHGSIGILPEWDVLYLTTTASVSAAIQRNAYSAGRYGIHFRDESTNRPIAFSSHATRVLGSGNGVSGIGTSSASNYTPNATGTSPATYSSTHHPSMGCMAYLLTGRFYHLETAQFVATINFLKNGDVNRQGSAGIFLSEAGSNTTRGMGWALRSLAQAASITPDADPLAAEFRASLTSNIEYHHARYVVQANNPQGFVQPYSDYTPPVVATTEAGSTSTNIVLPSGYVFLTDDYYNGQELVIGGEVRTVSDYIGASRTAIVSPAFTVPTASQPFELRTDNVYMEATWMQDFVTAALGYALAMPANLTSATLAKLRDLFAWKAKSIVGRFGTAETSQYLYRDAATYNIAVAPDNQSDFLTGAGPWYSTWGQVYDDTFAINGSPGSRVAGDLRGGNYPDATSYWGNLHPALAYAVEHAIPGAAAGWLRMTGASNYSSLAANFNTSPVWSAQPPLPPAWLSPVAVNEWVSIGSTQLSSVEPVASTAVSPSNPASKITAWCGAALRRSDAAYIVGLSGGHADYAGNEIDALRLNRDVPAWVEVSARSADAYLYNRSAFNSDSKGAAAHTYYYSQFLESLGLFVSFTNSGVDYGTSPSLPANPPAPWPYQNAGGAAAGYDFRWSPAFDLGGLAWKAPTYIPEFPTTSGDWTAAMCVKHPVTDDVYIARTGDRWRKFTAATQTWSNVSANYEENYCGAAIDHTRDRMLVAGGYNGVSAPRVRDLSGNTISVTFGGLGASALQGAGMQYAGVVYDEANDRYLVVKNSSPVSVYAVDAATWVVTLLTTTGTAPPQRSNGIQNSVQYVPNLGGRSGIVIATEYSGNVRFLRTA